MGVSFGASVGVEVCDQIGLRTGVIVLEPCATILIVVMALILERCRYGWMLIKYVGSAMRSG